MRPTATALGQGYTKDLHLATGFCHRIGPRSVSRNSGRRSARTVKKGETLPQPLKNIKLPFVSSGRLAIKKNSLGNGSHSGNRVFSRRRKDDGGRCNEKDISDFACSIGEDTGKHNQQCRQPSGRFPHQQLQRGSDQSARYQQCRFPGACPRIRMCRVPSAAWADARRGEAGEVRRHVGDYSVQIFHGEQTEDATLFYRSRMRAAYIKTAQDSSAGILRAPPSSVLFSGSRPRRGSPASRPARNASAGHAYRTQAA